MDYFYFVGWFSLAVIIGIYAHNKGRSGFFFFILSSILGPILGALIAFVCQKNMDVIENRKIDRGIAKRCPDCDEIVKEKAKICRTCHFDFTTVEEEE
jgi:hypothetical protein